MLSRVLGLILLTSIVTACEKSETRSMLERYAERVGNAIEEPVEIDFDLALAERSALPSRRQRLVEIPTIREGLIDVLEFRRCDLLHAIAERNTSLGRLAGYSQRLIYELEILPALRACRSRLSQTEEGEEEQLVRRLDEIIQLKERSLGTLIWNALYTSDEMEQQFALTRSPLPLLDDDTSLTPLRSAFSHFITLSELDLQEHWEAPNFTPALEQDFEALYRSDFGSRWLTSITLLTHTMERTSDAFERRLARRPICFNNRPNNQARIIRNVFQKFYAGEFQPYLSRVDREGREWLHLHQQILSRLPVPEDAQHYFLDYLNPDAPGGIWQRYLSARDRHTQSWQRLLRQCGMMPGS